MSIMFKNETFRDDYTFANSPEAIKRFPFPFDQDSYMYSVNVESHKPTNRDGSVFENAFDVDEHYLSELKDRAMVVNEDPLRCQSLPHMELHGWDLLELIMVEKAKSYPDLFELKQNGDNWHWINKALGVENKFVFGDASTLPYSPMEYITRQAQGDFCLMDQRDDNIFMDAGMVTSQADWSLDFNLGMSFLEWHAPVPDIAHKKGIFTKALKFLSTLQQGSPVRRLNWTMTVNPLLDTSPENYHKWGKQKAELTPDNCGEKQYLRVELQEIFRLPRSNGLAICIRCYMLSLEDIVTQPKWARRLHRVIRDIPDELSTYKGFINNKSIIVDYLSKFDDGLETSPGIWPDD